MNNYINLLSSNNVVFKTYVFYSVVLILKMFLMALLTGVQRFRKKSKEFPLSGGVPDLKQVAKQVKKTVNGFRDRISKYTSNALKTLTKVYISPEDLGLGQGKGEVKYDDPDVERIRRAHQNDLENIPIFLITGLLFVLTNPNEFLALTLLRLYTVFRFLHTIVYTMIIIRQPARALMFFCGLAVNITMCVLIVTKFFHM